MKEYSASELHHTFDTEKIFDEFISSIGGVVIKNGLRGNPNFLNSDYSFLHKHRKIYVELKSLQNDFAEICKLQSKIESLYRKWIDRGEITLSAIFNFNELTDFQRRKVVEVKYEPVRRVLKKANQQIKSTALSFGAESYSGLVILIIDGVKAIEFNNLFSAICMLLQKEKFSGIDGFVLMTMNHYVDIGNKQARQLWVPAYEDDNNIELSEFVNWLGSKWFEFFSNLIGGFEHDPIITDSIEPLRNTKNIF
ncbi:hypothetical protein [Alkanindiges illinoisensis]|uniref:hypothetical protein n=1 Tax=Alkanindiges illinoisensis TaxID=197183 RepID=UPI0012ECB641|nr:hypothetical protein [Alkanindiges illinoisensis]